MTTTDVPAEITDFVGHSFVIDAHLTWLSGGPRPETALQDNIYSNATMFAAIEASTKGKTVDVEALVRQATG